ncbi:MAG: hypothetical protein ACE5K4_05850 [Candidatus Hydrothermarchaeota archaeon]
MEKCPLSDRFHDYLKKIKKFEEYDRNYMDLLKNCTVNCSSCDQKKRQDMF